MPQPVKLSDSLIAAARDAAGIADRSIAAQVEHWATMGRAIEGKLTAHETASLKHAVRESAPSPYSDSRFLNAALASSLKRALSGESQTSFAAEMSQSASARYSTDPAIPGFILRENPDGSRTPGKFQDGRFIPVEVATEKIAK
jgi:hypothetical protein